MNADSWNIFLNTFSKNLFISPLNSHIIASKLLLPKINTAHTYIKKTTAKTNAARLFQLKMQTVITATQLSSAMHI